MVVYEPKEERRLRRYIPEFELVTRQLGLSWQLLDISHAFAEWLMANEYHEAYFEYPADLDIALEGFKADLIAKLVASIEGTSHQTVLALLGVGAVFGFTRASDIIAHLAPAVRGRLLVFFPGQFENNNYRLFDARDGWNYHAIPLVP